jgi:hypothetical protein
MNIRMHYLADFGLAVTEKQSRSAGSRAPCPFSPGSPPWRRERVGQGGFPPLTILYIYIYRESNQPHNAEELQVLITRRFAATGEFHLLVGCTFPRYQDLLQKDAVPSRHIATWNTSGQGGGNDA